MEKALSGAGPAPGNDPATQGRRRPRHFTPEPCPVQGVVSLQQSFPTRNTAVPVRVPAAAATLLRMRTRARKVDEKVGVARRITEVIPPLEPAGSL